MNTDLYVKQGADWFESADYLNDDNSPVDLSGYTFEGKFKTSYYAANASGNLVIQILNASAGNTLLSMNSAVTANIAAGKYYYDVLMTDTFGNVTRVLEGILTVTPGVTIS